MTQFLAWFYWNPSREIFTIPFIDRPLAWYGILFVTGFFLGFLIIVPMIKKRLDAHPFCNRDVRSWSDLLVEISENALLLKALSQNSRKELGDLRAMQQASLPLKVDVLSQLNSSKMSRDELAVLLPKGLISTKQQSLNLADKLTWYVVGGTLIGARLGHVLFYGWHYYRHNPLDILKIWEGGLASHGGAIGILVALFFFNRSLKKNYPEFTFLDLTDTLSPPVALAAFFIRLGNFFNQEIIGQQTTLPWAVIFGHPYGGEEVVPRHPAQLYEGACYLAIFGLLYTLWKRKGAHLKPGLLTGLLLILIFTARFFIEWVKLPQSMVIDETFLNVGQVLSIPFILLGLGIYFFPQNPTSLTRS